MNLPMNSTDEALVSSAFLDPTDPLRSLRNLLTVFVDIVRGLRYLHAKKLAHGNLSSAAVFIHATAHATLGGTLAVRGILEENAAEMVPGDLMAVGKIVWDATRRIMSMVRFFLIFLGFLFSYDYYFHIHGQYCMCGASWSG